MLKTIVVAIGAGVTVGAHAITGYRLHRWLANQAPALAAWIPPDGGVVIGILAGIASAWWWIGG